MTRAKTAAAVRPPAALGDACRRCGCTNDQACEGGCWWAAPGLCSACVGLDVLAAVPGQLDLLVEVDACPADPDGQHHVGCGCEEGDDW